MDQSGRTARLRFQPPRGVVIVVVPFLPERTAPTPEFLWSADDARIAARQDEYATRQTEIARLEGLLS